MTDLLSKEAIMAVADLKTGYHLGHADILILKGISQELMRRREAAEKPAEYKVVDPFGEITLRCEKCEAEMYREMEGWEVTDLFTAPPLPAVPDAIDAAVNEVLAIDTVASTAAIKSLFHQYTGKMRLDVAAQALPVVPHEITYEQACLEVSGLSPAEAYIKAWNARGAVPPLSGHRFSDAILNVINERQRQINAEGWTPKHDDRHTDGALALAASCYAYVAAIQSPGSGMSYEEWPKLKFWPWDEEWWKPTDSRRDLVKAAALIIAEIERIDRSGSEGSFHD